MKKWIREIAVGSGAAIVVLCMLMGVDITSLVFIMSLIGLGLMILSRRLPFGRSFEVVGANNVDSGGIPLVTFDDIGGQDIAKREFQEALTFLRADEKAKMLGIRPIKGVLLSGPPGTGKTLMAKAAANYTGSVFVAASGSQFVQMYAGVGAQRVRQLFKQARNLAEQAGKRSAIIFIDEIDVLGAKRGKNHGHMEYDQTLNELLTQFDGVNSEHHVQVLVVGATNRSDLLDPALLRPGRFDRVVRVDLPDKEGRRKILEIHSKGRPLSSNIDLDMIAQETYGFSGAHLESVLNEAAIHALRADRSVIEPVDMREAIEKVMLGEKLDRSPQPEEKERVAFHEVGHALVSEKVRPGSVASITITSRSNALGYIRQNPLNDQYLYTKDQLVHAIQVCVAGAVSEELILGQRSTGAVGDIEQATDLAKKMVFAGLSPLGIVGKDIPQELLHETVTTIIREQEDVVKEYLAQCKTKLEHLTERLLRNESMDGSEFRSVLTEKAS